jgi:hypothetical protein
MDPLLDYPPVGSRRTGEDQGTGASPFSCMCATCIERHLQFGEAVAFYFQFLASYTKFLTFISAAGVLFYFFAVPYSTFFSSALLVWAVTFVEWWRIKQRILSVQWGTRGSFRVEKRRAQYQPIEWWRRELRILSSVPLILFFAVVLACLLTSIFIFEAFVTQLYKGPGAKLLVCRGAMLKDICTNSFCSHSLRLCSSCYLYPGCLLFTTRTPYASRTGRTTATSRPTTRLSRSRRSRFLLSWRTAVSLSPPLCTFPLART